jgi:glycine oxidase
VNTPDVIIAGAGIIGVSIALELSERGARVLVLDRGEPGQEASSAAAGMLAPSDPETPANLRPLALASAELYPAYVERLESLSQMQVDFRRRGTIALIEASPLKGVEVPAEYRRLAPAEIQRMEPALRAGERQAFFVQDDSIDPALLMQAALFATAKAGIEVRGRSGVQAIRARSSGNGVEVVTNADRLPAPAVVDCRGAWSGPPVRPRKGQSLYLQPRRAGLIEHVINAFEVYLVPRSSGKILVGATVEDVGFDKTVEPNVIASLHRAAAALVPELAEAQILESWAGLRPGSPDDLPVLGPGPAEARGCFIATGHFRNGILLAPVTAKLMANLIMGKPAGWDMSPFSPARFSASHVNSLRNSD